jgi:ABC-type nitrate/sulfonate/bicarbonate transport system permease component
MSVTLERAARSAVGPDRPKRKLLWNPRAVVGATSIIVALLAWQALSDLGVLSKLIFSSPSDVVGAGLQEVRSAEFWQLASKSAWEFAVGFGLAAAIGLPLGVCIGWFRNFGYFLDPWINFFYSLPRIALTPLLLITFGIGQTAIIAVVFLGAIFEILLNTSNGAKVVDKRLLDVATEFGASGMRVFTGIVLPSSVPFMIVGLRLGVARALIGVIIGELFAGGTGLGQSISFASNSLQTGRVLFLTSFFLLIAIVMTESLRLVENKLGSWRNDIGGVR